MPFVPYLPLLSCFLNMLLLVSAADVMGIVEFLVLVALGECDACLLELVFCEIRNVRCMYVLYVQGSRSLKIFA